MNRPNNQEELNQSIYDMKQNAIKDLEDLQEKYNTEEPEDGIESLEGYREPLSIDVEKELNIMLSWGGPSDGYKLKYDKENNLISGVYWYADWGTYAEQQLEDSELDLVEQIYLWDPSIYLNQA